MIVAKVSRYADVILKYYLIKHYLYSDVKDDLSGFFFANAGIIKFEDTGFEDALYYAHADFRREIRNNHVSHETLLADAVHAEEVNSPVNGVHKRSFLFDLKYLKFESLNFESFHVLKNVCTRLQNLLFGDCPVSDNLRKSVIAEKIHPSLWDDKGKIVYEITSKEKNLIDAICNCTFIPKGYVNDYAMTNPIQQNGYLTGIRKINFSRILIPTLLAFTKLPKAYRVLYCLFAKVLNAFFSPIIKESDIEVLRLKIIELVAIKEGLFTNQECYVIFHQLVDLVEHVKMLGPFIGWNCLYGERMISMLKRLKPDGGKSYDKVIANRYLQKRNSIITDVFEGDKPIKSDLDQYNRIRLIGKPKTFDMSEIDLNKLTDAIVHVFETLRKLGIESEETLLVKSSVYRLYKCSRYHINDMNNNWCSNFYEFLSYCRVQLGKHFIYDVEEKNVKNLKSNVNHGLVFVKDLNSVHALLKKRTTFSTQISTCGVKIRGRGRMDGRLDSLSNCWNLSKHSSSWIRYYIRRDDRSKNLKLTSYAHANYFLRLHIEHDEVLNFMSFANITHRESCINHFSALDTQSTSVLTSVNVVRLSDQNDMHPSQVIRKFIPLVDILPTAVGVIPTMIKDSITKNLFFSRNPDYSIRLYDILPNNSLTNIENATEESKKFIITKRNKSNSNYAYGLIMIDLQPQNIEYIDNLYDPDVNEESLDIFIDKF